MNNCRFVDDATVANATIGTFQNIIPAKGSLYASDGTVYTKLPVGTNGNALTADSTSTQGVKWKIYSGPTNSSMTFNLFSCIGWNQTNTYYCSWGTNPPAGNHSNPDVMSFNFDTYVIAIGLKPRASTNSGQWAEPYPGGMWTGFLNLDIVGWADSANPNTTPATAMSPATPHFSISNTVITSQYMAYHSIRAPGTEIYIPAGTKFTIRSTFNATSQPDPNNDHYGTGNLVLRGIPN